MDEMREGLPEPAKEPWYESLNLEDTESFIESNLVSAAQNVIAIGYYNEFAGQDYESSYLHLVGGPEPDEHPSGAYGRWSRHERYNRFPNSETELVEFLKSIQKGERK